MNNIIENTLFQCRAINKGFGNVKANDDISINVRNSEIFLNGIKIGDYQQGSFSVSSTSDEIVIVNNQRVFRIPIGAKPNTKGFTNTNFPNDDEDFVFVEGSGYQNSKHKLCY